MDNQPQGALGPLPSAPKPMSPPPAPAPMQMPKVVTPSPAPKPMTPPPAMPPKMPMGDKPKSSGGMNPMLGMTIALAILMVIGVLVLYFRIDAVQSQVKTLGDKTYEELGEVQGKLNQLIETDKKREDLIVEMKKKMGEAGAMMSEKGGMMKTDGETMMKEGEAIKSSEAAKTDEAMMKKGETMMSEGDKMMKDGDAMMMEGQKIQTEAGTATP